MFNIYLCAYDVVNDKCFLYQYLDAMPLDSVYKQEMSSVLNPGSRITVLGKAFGSLCPCFLDLVILTNSME